MRRRLTLAGAGVGVAGVLVLTGCSGSHGDEAACPPPPPVASAGPASLASPVTAAPLASAHRSADALAADQAAKGSKGSGSKGSGGRGSKPGRTGHHHIDHHSSNDGTDGGYGHCHGAPAPTSPKPGGPATAPKK